MKWIEGRSGKSIVLERILKEEQGQKILLIDNVGVRALHSLVTDVMCFKSNEKMWEVFCDDEQYESFTNAAKEYDLIIFETNDSDMNIDAYGAIEDKIGVEVMITIQNNTDEVVSVHEV